MLGRFSHVQLFVTPWTVACQAPLSMELSGHEYWSELPFPSPEDLLDPGIEPSSPASPTLQADSLLTEQPGKPIYFPLFRAFTSHYFAKFSLAEVSNDFQTVKSKAHSLPRGSQGQPASQLWTRRTFLCLKPSLAWLPGHPTCGWFLYL